MPAFTYHQHPFPNNSFFAATRSGGMPGVTSFTFQFPPPGQQGAVAQQPFPDLFSFLQQATAQSGGQAPPNSFAAQMDNIASLIMNSMNDALGARGSGGNDFNRILNQLFEVTGPYGPPAASKQARDALTSIIITQAQVDNKEECAICKDEFAVGENTKRLPCSHMYHDQCIMPWLESRNSCPVCRYELPTDDPDYEARRAQRAQQSARTTPSSSSSSNTTSTSNNATGS